MALECFSENERNAINSKQHYQGQRPRAESSKPSPWASAWHCQCNRHEKQAPAGGGEAGGGQPWRPRGKATELSSQLCRLLTRDPRSSHRETGIIVLFDKVVKIHLMARCWQSAECWTDLSKDCDTGHGGQCSSWGHVLAYP